jgi:hypothetical protein
VLLQPKFVICRVYHPVCYNFHVSKPIKAITPFIILLGVISFDLLYLYVVILWLKPIAQGAQYYIPLAILGILILAFFMLLLVQLNRLQFLIVVDGDYLKTVSLYGKRTIKLSDIVDIKRVTWFSAPRSGSSIDCLKISNSSGRSLYVQFGVLSEKKRRLLYDSLKITFENPRLQHDQGASGLWDSWFDFARKQT